MNTGAQNVRRMVTAMAAVALGIGALGQSFTVGYADMEEVFQGYYKTTRSDAAFKKQKEMYDQHAEELAQEIEALKEQRDDLQERALNIALSEEARQESRDKAREKEAEYREKRQELKEFVQKKDKELGQKYLELRADIVKEITAFIGKYAENNGYDLVIDSSGLTRNFIPVVVYHPEEDEITEAVLAELNRGHEDEVAEAREEAGAGAETDGDN